MTEATTVRERPILFSAPMVRAILDGRKTQTRRIMKPQPEPSHRLHDPRCEDGEWYFCETHGDITNVANGPYRCPYGKPGDRLWVRETFAIESNLRELYDAPENPLGPVRWHEDQLNGRWFECPRYRASEPETNLVIADVDDAEDAMRWRPSIHMPRWASRITLEITDVRVERLQSISEEDATAEGAEATPESSWWMYMQKGGGVYETTRDVPRWTGDKFHDWVHRERVTRPGVPAKENFQSLWQSINGPDSWSANPWVWAISFRRMPMEAAK